MSAATSSGLRLWLFSNQRASLPTVVVLPEPCRPHTMMPVAPFLAQRTLVSTGPIILVSSSWHTLMKACSGVMVLTPYSLDLALMATCSPRAASLIRSRKRLVTL